MNRVFFIGRLTRDPELTETPSGVAKCRFALAVDREYRDADGERHTDFFECTAWRAVAEGIARYTAKGSKVHVEGSVQPREYEDNKGNKQKVVDIIVTRVEYLSAKARAEDGEDPQTAQPAKKKPTLSQMAIGDDDSDIPF